MELALVKVKYKTRFYWQYKARYLICMLLIDMLLICMLIIDMLLIDMLLIDLLLIDMLLIALTNVIQFGKESTAVCFIHILFLLY